MKNDLVEKIEKEIDEKIKLPSGIKNGLRKEVFRNIVIAIIVVSYFTFLILGSIGTIKNVRTMDFNIFSLLILSLAIYLFEVAYRKDSGKLAVYGIEALVTAIFTLFLPYIIFELDQTYKKYYLMISGYVAIYYIVKCVVIYLRGKKAYMRQVSDIKEIVKKEKMKSNRSIEIEGTELKQIDEYLQEEAKTKNTGKIDSGDIDKKDNKNTVKKRNTKLDEERKDDKRENTINKKNNNETVTNNKKKVSVKTEKQINKTEKTVNINVPKKRGRPKKEETLKKEEQNKNVNSELKKRGRPRKVVTSND